jgi:hypothetical protein
MNRVAQQAEVEANLIAFEADLPSLLAKSKASAPPIVSAG